MNNANQTMINDVMTYDEIDGNEVAIESVIGMLQECRDGWARVSLPGGLELNFWFKSKSLSYDFDTSVAAIKK